MIQKREQLPELLERIRQEPIIGLDTEADSLHAFPEKLCLLQISVPGEDLLIDPLAVSDLGPLWSMLQEKDLVLHGADYDLRLLHRSFQFLPRKVFDTMWAARLLGFESFGLGDLVRRFFDVILEKGSQKANWARRPLTPRMQIYARNDTHFLLPLAIRLREALEGAGRLSWHEEICDRMIRDCTQNRSQSNEDAWRLKGSDQLTPHGLAILRALWAWRDQEARRVNTPPFFILRHDVLVQIAAEASQTKPFQDLLPRSWSSRRVHAVQETVRKAQSLASEQWPQRRTSKRRRMTPAQREKLERLQRHRDRRAAELGVEPALLASRATLVALAVSETTGAGDLMAWQRDLLETARAYSAVDTRGD